MRNGENNPDRIPMAGSNKQDEHELIIFTVKGKKETVTPSEALSIINTLSASLMAYNHSGGYSNFEKKYLT